MAEGTPSREVLFLVKKCPLIVLQCVICVSSYKGRYFFTLIIHELFLCVGYCIAVGE